MQNTTERVEEKNKQTNKQTRTWVSSKRKKGIRLWHFWAFCELTRACTRAKTLASNADLSSLIGQPSLCKSTGLSSHLSDFCSSLFSALLSSPDCLLLLSFVDCSLLLPSADWPSLGPSFPRPSGHVGNLKRRPFVWVSRQSSQRDLLTGSHAHQHNEYPT